MIKVLVACGCGMGSSQMLKMNCSKVLDSLGIEHEITHTSIGEAKSMAHDYDVVIVAETFVSNFEKLSGTKVVGLRNIMSKPELRQKIEELGLN